jgi:hypothetical protein
MGLVIESPTLVRRMDAAFERQVWETLWWPAHRPLQTWALAVEVQDAASHPGRLLPRRAMPIPGWIL